jgi:transposase-like protein
MKLKGYRFPRDVILQSVRWYLRYNLSYRDLEEIDAELESEWAQAIGVRELAKLRGDLTKALLAMHGGELPPVRPTP